MFGVPFLLFSFYFILFLTALLHTNEGGPVSNQQRDHFKQKVKRRLSVTKKNLQIVRRKQNRFLKSQENANEQKVSIEHTSRKKWLETDEKHERANENINRHLIGAKLFGKEVPAIGEVLTHRANLLKEKTHKFQDRKDRLKSEGTENEHAYNQNYLNETSKYLKFAKKVENYQRSIRTHTASLSGDNQTRKKNQKRAKVLGYSEMSL